MVEGVTMKAGDMRRVVEAIPPQTEIERRCAQFDVITPIATLGSPPVGV